MASPWILAVSLLTTGLMIIAAYLQDDASKTDPGTTTVAAVLVAFCLGALVWFGHGKLAVMLAIVTTVLLYFKAELKGLSERLTRTDLVSILQFAVLSLVVLPILPNRAYPPFDALNPHQVWLMVVLIAGVSLAGYIALRVFGPRAGAPLLGVLGGLVSSTATTTVYARHARSQDNMIVLSAVVILLANLVVLVRIGVLMSVAAPRALPALLPVLGAALALGFAATLAALARHHGGRRDADATGDEPDRDPHGACLRRGLRGRARAGGGAERRLRRAGLVRGRGGIGAH